MGFWSLGNGRWRTEFLVLHHRPAWMGWWCMAVFYFLLFFIFTMLYAVVILWWALDTVDILFKKKTEIRYCMLLSCFDVLWIGLVSCYLYMLLLLLFFELLLLLFFSLLSFSLILTMYLTLLDKIEDSQCSSAYMYLFWAMDTLKNKVFRYLSLALAA